ncbi:hypothetical protein CSKR_203174 [Clonorchis sinensis]|uniref:Uncharacterized protein n=1 Tax=Clonorchis sinensis TaxID=79923 RepID=A0A8T1M8J3_CLOSI|nr:hypothetical protein CSKR_203174 [Clonorchis sinensis]
MNLHIRGSPPGLFSLLGFSSSTTLLLRFQLLDGVCLIVVPPVLGVAVDYFHAILPSAERRPKGNILTAHDFGLLPQQSKTDNRSSMNLSVTAVLIAICLP